MAPMRFRVEWSATKLVYPALDAELAGRPVNDRPAYTNTGGWLNITDDTPEGAIRQFRKVEPKARILSITPV